MSSKSQTEKLKANLELLKERFPNVFFDTKPLVPTIIDDMVKELGSDPLTLIVKQTMRYYMHTSRYLRNVVKRKWIRDVHGSKVRLITQSEKQEAQKILDTIASKFSQERAERNFAIALAKESSVEFKKAELLSQTNKYAGKVLVITRKSKSILDKKDIQE